MAVITERNLRHRESSTACSKSWWTDEKKRTCSLFRKPWTDKQRYRRALKSSLGGKCQASEG